jgi:hypothetical protein
VSVCCHLPFSAVTTGFLNVDARITPARQAIS